MFTFFTRNPWKHKSKQFTLPFFVNEKRSSSKRKPCESKAVSDSYLWLVFKWVLVCPLTVSNFFVQKVGLQGRCGPEDEKKYCTSAFVQWSKRTFLWEIKLHFSFCKIITLSLLIYSGSNYLPIWKILSWRALHNADLQINSKLNIEIYDANPDCQIL